MSGIEFGEKNPVLQLANDLESQLQRLDQSVASRTACPYLGSHGPSNDRSRDSERLTFENGFTKSGESSGTLLSAACEREAQDAGLRLFSQGPPKVFH